MPKGMQPIYTRTLSGLVYTMAFNNIPQTFTDLKIVISGRTDWNAAFDGGPSIFFNGLTAGSLYSETRVRGDGSSATSARTVDNASYIGEVPAATATANTFSNCEIYIPEYRSGKFKSFLIDNVAENNASTAWVTFRGGLAQTIAPITSIGIYGGAGNWVANSTFTLYGISR